MVITVLKIKHISRQKL